MMQGIKLVAVAAALSGAAMGFGPAQAAPIGMALTRGANPAIARVEYRSNYGCFPWNDAWGYPGCQGYERAVSGEPVVECRSRRTRHGLRRFCSRQQ